MEDNIDKQIAYEKAKKRVKAIKGFYIHALIYVLVFISVIIYLFQKFGFLQINKLDSFGLWGIGLAIHGLSVFLPNFILGSNWEERKIKEIMGKNRNVKN